MKYTPRLKQKYQEEIIPALMKEFSYKNIMQVPRLKKIAVNQGLGSAIADKKLIDTGIEEMTNITGQRAVATKVEERHLQLQAAPRYADWCKGYPSRRPDV
jgi:large subunit ribosomal protein L5